MKSTNELQKRLKSIGHDLKPVVIIAGKGLSENVINEIERALNDHELIKIKIEMDDRNNRRELLDGLKQATYSEVIQNIGKVALIYRKSTKKNLKLSNLAR